VSESERERSRETHSYVSRDRFICVTFLDYESNHLGSHRKCRWGGKSPPKKESMFVGLFCKRAPFLHTSFAKELSVCRGLLQKRPDSRLTPGSNLRAPCSPTPRPPPPPPFLPPHDSFICVTCFNHVCDMTHVLV